MTESFVAKELQLDLFTCNLIAKQSQLDDELTAVYANLQSFLTDSLRAEIFPRRHHQIRSFLDRIPELVKQVNEEQQLITVTGKRALVALNNLFFRYPVLENEVFFRAKTLFIIGAQATGTSSSHPISARVQMYNKEKMTVHKEFHFECVNSMNQELAKELITLEFDKEFDGLLVEIHLPCPLLNRFKFVTAPKVDATTKELLDLMISTNTDGVSNRLCLMLHFLAPNVGRETDTKAAESELRYLCSMAKRSQLLLLCEHLRGKKDDVATIVQKFVTVSACVCYYTQWQWDGLCAVQPQLQNLLRAQSHKRSVQLAKTATKELGIQFKVVHEIRRNINLCKDVANKQKRPSKEYQRDFMNLQAHARKLSEDFGRLVDAKIRQLSVLIAQHLRNGQVRGRIIKSILGRTVELKESSDHKVENAFLEEVAKEIREWNNSTHHLDRADEFVSKDKTEKFKDLCTRANDIPEMILVNTDMLNSSEQSSGQSGDSDTKSSIQTIADDMVRTRLRKTMMENVAAGIAAPLWVPLAAITMAIIAPVIRARRTEQSVETFQSKLRGMVQDFLDKLDSELIRTQFFSEARMSLDSDAKRIREFIELYCILPSDHSISVNSRFTECSLMQHLADLEEKLQFLHSGLMMLQVERLGCEILSREACKQLGVDMDVDDWVHFGTELARNKPVFVVNPPNAAQRPLVLKLAKKGIDSHCLLLEIDIVKSVSLKKHDNIIPWIGTVYFPKLKTIGFLTNKYDCDLWEFIRRHESRAVPNKSPMLSESRKAAFVVCRNTCEQVFSGVHLLHSMQILHRDLKLENVLIEIQQDKEPLHFVAKLCDFGLAKHESEISGSTFGDTIGYMAPELQKPRPLFSDKSDIYALGIIAWECYFGQRIFEQPGAIKTLHTGDNEPWDFMVETMTREDPVYRPLIEQCLDLLHRLDKKMNVGPLPTIGPNTKSKMPSLEESLKSLKLTIG